LGCGLRDLETFGNWIAKKGGFRLKPSSKPQSHSECDDYAGHDGINVRESWKSVGRSLPQWRIRFHRLCGLRKMDSLSDFSVAQAESFILLALFGFAFESVIIDL